MIVAGIDVIAYLFLPGDHAEAGRATLAAVAARAAPLLRRSEFRNALALHLRREHLTLAVALGMQPAAEELLAGRAYAVESEAVLTLANASGRSAYDCEFAALARARAGPFVTPDRRLLASLPETAVALSSFVDDA